MIKKFMAYFLLIVCFINILCLNGCSGDPNQAFFNQLEKNSSIKNYKLQQTLNVQCQPQTTSSSTGNVDISSIQWTLSGNANKNVGANFDLYLNNKDSNNKVDTSSKTLTNLMYNCNDEKLYINVKKMNEYLEQNNVLSLLQLNSDSFKNIFNNQEYLEIDLNSNNLRTILGKEYQIFKKAIINRKAIAYHQDTLDLSLNGEDLYTILKDMASSLKSDLPKVYDSIKNMPTTTNKQNFVANGDKYIDSLLEDFKSNDLKNTNVTFSVKDKYLKVIFKSNNYLVQFVQIIEDDSTSNVNTKIDNIVNLNSLDLNRLFSISTVSDNQQTVETKNTDLTSDTYIKKTISKSESTKQDSNSFISDIEERILDNGFKDISVIKALTKTELYSSKDPKSNGIDYITDETKVGIVNNNITDFELTNSYSLDDFKNYTNNLVSNTREEASKIINSDYKIEQISINKDELVDGYNQEWEENNKLWKFKYSVNVSGNVATLTLNATSNELED
jgi:hypothetical protein